MNDNNICYNCGRKVDVLLKCTVYDCIMWIECLWLCYVCHSNHMLITHSQQEYSTKDSCEKGI